MRPLLGLILAALLLVGVGHATAAEGEDPTPAPAPADQFGTLWFADPSNPPAPAGALERVTATPPTPLPVVAPSPPAEPADLPRGIPAAARRPEPALPAPEGWPFGEAFPRTSGAGRLHAGAFFWSDFLYDDNGAIGAPPPTNESTGAPSLGTYRYPAPSAHRNGADLFRVGVGREGAISYWRVDWNTLADPSVPAAVFTIDADPDTGVADWPANTGLRSPGIDWAVVLSGASARVIDLRTGTEHPATLTVDRAARSFVARTTAVPLSGEAEVRVAAGLADDAGSGFRQLDTDHGALPGQPNAYNVGYRDYADEPSAGNTWYDTGQATALSTGGDVSAFSATVDWDALARQVDEPEPLLPGFTNRWYVSSIELGQGVADPGQGISVDGPAAYRGRVQPYAIYVPTTYAGSPAPLTWMLHGASSSHNSAQVHPRYTELACERRGSICVSPLGRGPSGGWRGYAELDVWEVWNRVAATYALDVDRTIISGISMGGFGTYKLAMDHPEAFAGAAVIVAHAGREEAGHDRLTNLRWTPLYARHGIFDQLVPVTDALATEAELDRLELRHVFDLQPAEDHVVVALKDGYDDVAEYFAGVGPRAATPPRISYAWDTPSAEDLAWGIDRPGAWWLDGLGARETSERARVEATTVAIPDRSVTVLSRDEPRLLGSPSPAIRHVVEWELGEAAPTRAELHAELSNVGALTLDLGEAGLGAGTAVVVVQTDGAVQLTFDDLGRRKARIDRRPVKGATLHLEAGRHRIELR